MDIVAMTAMATSVEQEAPLLANDLGIAVFEARQKLAVGLPCVLLAAQDRSRTVALVSAVRARGHSVLACDSRAIVPSGEMTQVRRFRLEDDALVLEAGTEAETEEVVMWADLLALIRATFRRTTETREETKERTFRPVAALASGGIVLTKTVKRDVVRTNEEREQALYLFRRQRRPCLLRETAAQYGGLGSAIRPTKVENFLTTYRLLKERARGASVDERLLTTRRFPEPPNEPGEPRRFDTETGGVDMLAHIVAMSLTRSP